MQLHKDTDRWLGSNRGPYIRLHNGKKCFLGDPKPADYLEVADLAYHLAGIYRYTGGSRISVAQHQVVAGEMAARFYPGVKLLPARCHVHDVTEGRIGDVSSPLKALLPDYKDIEHRHDSAAEEAYGITWAGDNLVKEVDYRMWLTERLLVWPDSMRDQIAEDYTGPLEPFPLTRDELRENFGPWPPGVAEMEWLMGFRNLLPWVEW